MTLNPRVIYLIFVCQSATSNADASDKQGSDDYSLKLNLKKNGIDFLWVVLITVIWSMSLGKTLHNKIR